MNGKPDTLKGSYYANPTLDVPGQGVSEANKKAYPESYSVNICEWTTSPHRVFELS